MALETNLRCRKGSTCGYCHLDHLHIQDPAHRPRKEIRDRYKRSVLPLLQGQHDLEPRLFSGVSFLVSGFLP